MLAMTPGNRIKEARKSLRISQRELARLCGWKDDASGASRISNYENNFRAPSSADYLKLAKALKKTSSWLQYGTSNAVEDIDLANIPGIIQLEYKELPILDDSDIIELAQSGQFKDNYERKLNIMDSRIKLTKNQFAYEIINDAMVDPSNPDKSIFNGEFAIIDRGIKEEAGDIVLALIPPNNVKLRQLNQDGSDFWLDALNPRYPRLPINRNEITILGTLIGAQTKMRIFKQKVLDNTPFGMVGGGGRPE